MTSLRPFPIALAVLLAAGCYSYRPGRTAPVSGELVRVASKTPVEVYEGTVLMPLALRCRAIEITGILDSRRGDTLTFYPVRSVYAVDRSDNCAGIARATILAPGDPASIRQRVYSTPRTLAVFAAGMAVLIRAMSR
ncbi:MAG TPA: hypothetical protein VHM30_17775 [Gemmatimonadaceae bacterium]|nr:hypothetical protein [Gemmatimonadaceae bacterium]